MNDKDLDNEADEPITPASPQTPEEAAQELKRKTDEIERKVADGN